MCPGKQLKQFLNNENIKEFPDPAADPCAILRSNNELKKVTSIMMRVQIANRREVLKLKISTS